MAQEKTITIGEIPIKFRASAATLRLYRDKFGRDLLVDFENIQGSAKDVADSKDFSRFDMELIENLPYILAKAADRKGVPDDVCDWLDQFDTQELFAALPEVMKLWGDNMNTLSKAKKKADPPSEK